MCRPARKNELSLSLSNFKVLGPVRLDISTSYGTLHLHSQAKSTFRRLIRANQYIKQSSSCYSSPFFGRLCSRHLFIIRPHITSFILTVVEASHKAKKTSTRHRYSRGEERRIQGIAAGNLTQDGGCCSCIVEDECSTTRSSTGREPSWSVLSCIRLE